MIKLGLQSLQFLSSPQRPLVEQLDEFYVIAGEADRLGFDWISASQHWMSSPTVWPQPFPLLARLAAEVKRMRLMTQMLLLPLHNPIDVAEQVATIDHLSHGRLDLGMAIGYREVEMVAAGYTRRDRASRMEESLALLPRLWAGEEVVHEGRWWTINGGRIGFGPLQRPHPPMILAAQSPAATRRAARLADGVFYGPQLLFSDIGELATLYRQEAKVAGVEPGVVGAGRALMMADDLESAVDSARDYIRATASMYGGWDMQEPGMAKLAGGDGNVRDWAIAGDPEQCIDGIMRAHQFGLTHITLTAYNLPTDFPGRLEYVRRVGEEIVQPVKRRLEGVEA